MSNSKKKDKDEDEEKFSSKVNRWSKLTRTDWAWEHRPSHRATTISAVESNEKLKKAVVNDLKGINKFEKELDILQNLSISRPDNPPVQEASANYDADDYYEQCLALRQKSKSKLLRKNSLSDEVANIINLAATKISLNALNVLGEDNVGGIDYDIDKYDAASNDFDGATPSNPQVRNPSSVAIENKLNSPSTIDRQQRLNLLRRHNQGRMKNHEESKEAILMADRMNQNIATAAPVLKSDTNILKEANDKIYNANETTYDASAGGYNHNIDEISIDAISLHDEVPFEKSLSVNIIAIDSTGNHNHNKSPQINKHEHDDFFRRQLSWLSNKEEKSRELQQVISIENDKEFTGIPNLTTTKLSFSQLKSNQAKPSPKQNITSRIIRHSSPRIADTISSGRVAPKKSLRKPRTSPLKEKKSSFKDDLDYKALDFTPYEQTCKIDDHSRSHNKHHFYDSFEVSTDREVRKLSGTSSDRNLSADEGCLFFDPSSRHKGKHVLIDPKSYDSDSLFRRQDVNNAAVTLLYGKRRGSSHYDLIMLFFDLGIFSEVDASKWWMQNKERLMAMSYHQ